MLEGLRAYKERTLDPGLKVAVYRNLRNGLLSVQQKGLVIGHIERITITDVNFHVDLTKHSKVIASKSKNVHAVASGYVTLESVQDAQSERVRYNPYTAPYFRVREHTRIDNAYKLHVDCNGYMIAETK